MKHVLPLLLLGLAVGGCSYGRHRLEDFKDIWRLEASAGPGLQLDAKAGGLLHLGLGSSDRIRSGMVYGEFRTREIREDHLPLSYILTCDDSDEACLHRVRVKDRPNEDHEGFLIFPADLNRDSRKPKAIRYFDLEAGFHALFLGLNAGIGLGEVFDWILGWFRFNEDWTWLDPAGDDS